MTLPPTSVCYASSASVLLVPGTDEFAPALNGHDCGLWIKTKNNPYLWTSVFCSHTLFVINSRAVIKDFSSFCNIQFSVGFVSRSLRESASLSLSEVSLSLSLSLPLSLLLDLVECQDVLPLFTGGGTISTLCALKKQRRVKDRKSKTVKICNNLFLKLNLLQQESFNCLLKWSTLQVFLPCPCFCFWF